LNIKIQYLAVLSLYSSTCKFTKKKSLIDKNEQFGYKIQIVVILSHHCGGEARGNPCRLFVDCYITPFQPMTCCALWIASFLAMRCIELVEMTSIADV
jgi:hypothetical protein